MPFRAVESVAAADSVATSALLLDLAVDCLAFGKKFRRGPCFEAGDAERLGNIACGVFSNSTGMVSTDRSKFNSSPNSLQSNAKMPPEGQVRRIRWQSVAIALISKLCKSEQIRLSQMSKV